MYPLTVYTSQQWPDIVQVRKHAGGRAIECQACAGIDRENQSYSIDTENQSNPIDREKQYNPIDRDNHSNPIELMLCRYGNMLVDEQENVKRVQLASEYLDGSASLAGGRNGVPGSDREVESSNSSRQGSSSNNSRNSNSRQESSSDNSSSQEEKKPASKGFW